jgi:hypothetical protein
MSSLCEAIRGVKPSCRDRIVTDVAEAESRVVERRVGVPEDERDVDLAVPQHMERLDRVLLEQAELDSRVGGQPDAPGL